MRYAAVLLAALTLAGCEVNLNSEGIVSRDTRSFKVTGAPDLDLTTFTGSIEIHSWDRNEVEIEIEKRAMEQRLVDKMIVTADQQGNRITFKVAAPSGGDTFGGVQIGVHFSPSARLRVAVPRQTQLVVTSGDGSISVEDVSGKMVLRTSDGSIRGTRLQGHIEARSGDGSIRLERAEGTLDLETDDGSITVEARPSVLRARTSDGTIRLEVQPDAVMSEDWDVQTSDGSVVLTLPAGFNTMIDAETRDGVVRSNLPSLRDQMREEGERAPERDREDARRTLRATLGEGGKTLRVRTGDGSIRIE